MGDTDEDNGPLSPIFPFVKKVEKHIQTPGQKGLNEETMSSEVKHCFTVDLAFFFLIADIKMIAILPSQLVYQTVNVSSSCVLFTVVAR